MNIAFSILLILSIVLGAVFKYCKDNNYIEFAQFFAIFFVACAVTLLLISGHFIAVALNFFC